MSKHLERDLEHLQKRIVGYAGLVEDAIFQSVRAMQEMGDLIEFGDTDQIFTRPLKKRTEEYVTGRFG